jgi:hypothetical protein
MTEETVEALKYAKETLGRLSKIAQVKRPEIRKLWIAMQFLDDALNREWTWPKELSGYKYLTFDKPGNTRAWLERPNLVHVGNDLVFCGSGYIFVSVEPPAQAVLPALIANPELVEDIP